MRNLGTPNEQWWPNRMGLSKAIREFEAESACYLVCGRAGIDNPSRQVFSGLHWTTYNTLALLYLIALGASGTGGFLLWPAVAVHAVLSALLVRGHLTGNQAKPS